MTNRIVSYSTMGLLLGGMLSVNHCYADTDHAPPDGITFNASSSGNIFRDESATINVTANKPGAAISTITIKDENGIVVSTINPEPTSKAVSIPLKDRGFYSIQVTTKDGISASTTAAVIKDMSAEAGDINSPFGLWHVHGDLKYVTTAGARWTRLMWTLSDYQKAASGAPMAKPRSGPGQPFQNFNLIGVLSFGLPNWLQTRVPHAVGKLAAPQNRDDISALVKRFAEDMNPFPEYFEVYNEPEQQWQGQTSDLVQFLKTIAAAIKSVHPSTKVLAPSLSTMDVAKVKEFGALGLFDSVDGISMHDYVKGTAPEGEFIGNVRELKSYLKSINKADLPLFITEYGWTSEPGVSWQPPVSEIVQAQYAARSAALLHAENVKAFLYFCLFYNAATAEQGFSTIHRDGTPKPAYVAYTTAIRWLTSTYPGGRSLQGVGGVNFSLFDSDNGAVLSAWTTNGKGAVIFPEFADSQEDMMGKPLPRSNSFKVTASPSYFFVKDRKFYNAVIDPPGSASAARPLPVTGEYIYAPAPLKTEKGMVLVTPGTQPGVYAIFFRKSLQWHIQLVAVS